MEEKVLKNIKLGRRNDKILIVETWQVGDYLKLEEKEADSIRDYLLSLRNFKDVPIEEESKEISREITNQIVGELITKEKYKFLPSGLVGEIVRDAFELLKEVEKK